MEDMKKIDWFDKRQFGLFIHFGVYAIEAWHEQDQMRRRIPRAEYAKLMGSFNPINFDADAIIDLAEQAGMSYLCITTKHHDGFCMWDTKETDFNIMNSPYGKDLIKELADACHKRNFSLGLYYSVADWRHPNYPNEGRHHELAKPEEGDVPDWDKYIEYLKAQVTELCTNYGAVKHFFWDMNVPECHDESINQLIKDLQPGIVINDRGCDDGDFGTPERDYDKSETDALSYFKKPTEACNSVGTQSWGYRADEEYYTSAFLASSIDKMMSKGANYLLNVGPGEKGVIPEQSRMILEELGAWFHKVKESFVDTSFAGNLTSNEDVILTRKDNTLYVHINQPLKADAILLPPISQLPESAILLNTGEQIKFANDVIPMYWESEKKILRLKNIPTSYLDNGCPLVFKLEFANLDDATKSDVAAAFEG
jgi:alpha-L-fucosidase